MGTGLLSFLLTDFDANGDFKKKGYEDRPDFIKSADEWIALPDSLEAIARLSRAGWRQ